MKVFLIILLALAFFILSVSIGVNNEQVVVFNYLIAEKQMNLSSLLAFLFGLGFVVSWFICLLFYFRLRLKLASARRQSRRLQFQLDEQRKQYQQQQNRAISSDAQSF